VAIPPWLTIGQTAAYCGVDRAEVYYKMLRGLEIRRIGVRGGVLPVGCLIRVEGESGPARVVPTFCPHLPTKMYV
jgi:hypothetical protein